MLESELFTAAGIAVALLGFSALIRLPRRDGGLRRWEGNSISTHVVLLMLPGVGLWALAGVGQLLIGESNLILLALVPALVGTIMVFWGLLFLPIPRWFLPSDVKARAKAHNA